MRVCCKIGISLAAFWVVFTTAAHPAQANIGYPLISLVMPGMALSLPIIVLVEGAIFAECLNVSVVTAFAAATVANLASTFVGIPIAWFVLLFILPSVTWLPPDTKPLGEKLGLSLLTLLFPFCAASIFIEDWVVHVLFGWDYSATIGATIIGNVITYELLAVAILVLMLMDSRQIKK